MFFLQCYKQHMKQYLKRVPSAERSSVKKQINKKLRKMKNFKIENFAERVAFFTELSLALNDKMMCNDSRTKHIRGRKTRGSRTNKDRSKKTRRSRKKN